MSSTGLLQNDHDNNAAGNSAGAVGLTLKSAREKQNLSIDEIATNLCIRPNYLRSIENGEYDRLPAMVYTRGFVRSYAEYLKLDSAAMVEKFRTEAGERNIVKETVYTPSNTNKQMPSRNLLVGSVAGFVVLVAVWGMLSSPSVPSPATDDNSAVVMEPSRDDELSPLAKTNGYTPPEAAVAVPSTPPVAVAPIAPVAQNITVTAAPIVAAPAPESVPTTVTTAPITAAPVASPQAPTAPASQTQQQPAAPPQTAPAAAQNGLVLEVIEDSWVEIADNNENVLYRKVLRAGEVLPIAGRMQNAVLSTGNAGGIAVRVNGKRVGVLGRHGEVVHGITLEARGLTSMARELPH